MTATSATIQAKAPRASGTRILFDLKDHLTAAELEKFQKAAANAGAPSLTDHFLNLTLRIPHGAGLLNPNPNQASPTA